MLQCLRVRDFAIIDELDVEFGAGFNVLTGETGAGKSILIDALQLLLGARIKPDVIRTGVEQAEVEALFDIGDDAAAKARMEAAGFEPSNELVIRRVIQTAGRTKAYVNGRLASSAQLGTLTAGLADISSQHEHQTLVHPANHLRYLDAFAKLDSHCVTMELLYESLRSIAGRLEEALAKVRNRSEREELLRYQLKELEGLHLGPNEETLLSEERARLRHAEHLAEIANSSEEALYAKDDALCEQLSRVTKSVETGASIDTRLEPLASELQVVRQRLEEVARNLGRYAREITVDPDRLRELDEQFDQLSRLKRKYGGSLEAILEQRERIRAELLALDASETAFEALEKERSEHVERARVQARYLRSEREKAAGDLGKKISRELASLGMGDARVEVEVAPLEGRAEELQIDGARLSPRGTDRVEFVIAPNRGEAPRPLRKIASGGELSRSLLAIKRVLAGLGPGGLYVFDEVDAGVGGAVAEVIGQKLREIAKHHQVLCITHLAPIAVHADHHYFVKKQVLSGRTRSTIAQLTPDERLQEIARMLGGIKVTPKTRAAAEEMLKHAHG